MNREQIRKATPEELRHEVIRLNNGIKDLELAYKQDMENLKSRLGDVFIQDLMPLAEDILRHNHRLKEASIEKFTTAYIEAVRDKLKDIAGKKEE